MATKGSIAGRDIFEDMNIDYEHAYGHNPFKRACITKAISLLEPKSRVLDAGCGTGVPTAQMLAEAGMDVHGFDIAPKMVELARKCVPNGTFTESDLIEYEPKTDFDGVFIIFSHLNLDYAAFHQSTFKLAKALRPNGILVIGQNAADGHVPPADPAYDASQSYVENYKINFLGKDNEEFMMTRAGQLNFLVTMGLDIVYETVDDFQPDHPQAHAEHQQYVIARRPGDRALNPPLPLPVK